jgi:signal transduction histidine kinase
LHDVVTHHVTAMVAQADATQFLAESPDRVVAALTAIGGTGRRALSELRFLLGVLETNGDPAGSRSPAGGTVRDLVERTRTGGQPVELVEDGDRPALPVGAGLAVYRVVQEGLTNAVKYATGQPTVVRVRYAPACVEVEVTNAAAPTPVPGGARRDLSGGRGLTGLRERGRMLGGELTAGERPDGGFRLHTRIPVGGDA